MAEPDAWTRFCVFLDIPPPLGQRLWKGLTLAQWSEAITLRDRFTQYQSFRIPWQGRTMSIRRGELVTEFATPAMLIGVLLNCRAERVITREDMRHCAGIILEWMKYDEQAAQAWDATNRPLWMYGPRPDFSRWLSKAERQQQRH